MSAVQRLRGAADALELSMLAEVDVRELPKKRLQWASTADWFTHLTGGFRRDGRRKVRHARAMTSNYTATLDSVRSGETSLAQAGIICEAVETLPTNPALRTEAEQALLDQSRNLTATELVRAGRHLAAVVDPDGEERATEAALDRQERAAHLQRFLSVVGDGAGGIRIKGYGSTEDGEVIRAALLPLTNECRLSTPTTRRARPRRTPVTTAPGCGTPSSRPPNTHSTRTCHSSPTAPGPGSWSPPPRRTSETTGGGRATETGLEPRSPPSAGWPATPRSSPVLDSDGIVLDVGRAQ